MSISSAQPTSLTCDCYCGPPQPWTCNPNDLNQNSFISPFGCKKPEEVYDPISRQCCACDCSDQSPQVIPMSHTIPSSHSVPSSRPIPSTFEASKINMYNAKKFIR